jgi:glycosyltransferase involved in cell wall biosynthesis
MLGVSSFNFLSTKILEFQNMNHKISIICPTFNVGPRMRDTLDGILAQTYLDWELLVMDGGSNDETVDLVKSYSAKDSRIKIYSEPDEGTLHACEKGLALASGDFLIIACGQDYFTDPNWFSIAIKVLEGDEQISLVWALGRGITEEGRDVGTNASYSHFIEGRGRWKSFRVFLNKSLVIAKVLLFSSWQNKKFIISKIFSSTASLRIHSITASGFPQNQFPQKEDWFFYWLKTGLVFPDQCLVVSMRVYLECAPRYKMGSKRANSFNDFIFNFNVKGYLAYFVPAYVGYGLLHATSSGHRAAKEIHLESEKYFNAISSFRKNKSGQTFTFLDRNGNAVSKRVIK